VPHVYHTRTLLPPHTPHAVPTRTTAHYHYHGWVTTHGWFVYRWFVRFTRFGWFGLVCGLRTHTGLLVGLRTHGYTPLVGLLSHVPRFTVRPRFTHTLWVGTTVAPALHTVGFGLVRSTQFYTAAGSRTLHVTHSTRTVAARFTVYTHTRTRTLDYTVWLRAFYTRLHTNFHTVPPAHVYTRLHTHTHVVHLVSTRVYVLHTFGCPTTHRLLWLGSHGCLVHTVWFALGYTGWLVYSWILVGYSRSSLVADGLRLFTLVVLRLFYTVWLRLDLTLFADVVCWLRLHLVYVRWFLHTVHTWVGWFTFTHPTHGFTPYTPTFGCHTVHGSLFGCSWFTLHLVVTPDWLLPPLRTHTRYTQFTHSWFTHFGSVCYGSRLPRLVTHGSFLVGLPGLHCTHLYVTGWFGPHFGSHGSVLRLVYGLHTHTRFYRFAVGYTTVTRLHYTLPFWLRLPFGTRVWLHAHVTLVWFGYGLRLVGLGLHTGPLGWFGLHTHTVWFTLPVLFTRTPLHTAHGLPHTRLVHVWLVYCTRRLTHLRAHAYHTPHYTYHWVYRFCAPAVLLPHCGLPYRFAAALLRCALHTPFAPHAHWVALHGYAVPRFGLPLVWLGLVRFRFWFTFAPVCTHWLRFGLHVPRFTHGSTTHFWFRLRFFFYVLRVGFGLV